MQGKLRYSGPNSSDPLGKICMKGSMEKPLMSQFLEKVKLKFEDSKYILYGVFSLQCSSYFLEI